MSKTPRVSAGFFCGSSRSSGMAIVYQERTLCAMSSSPTSMPPTCPVDPLGLRPISPLRKRRGMHIRGAALVESLVAMTVFAIGSAATGAWFVQSMAQGARASRIMAATVIAVSLEARLRANRVAAVEGRYGEESGVAQDCANGCDPRELAADDMARFHRALRERLGDDATGEVRCDAGGLCIITLQWHPRGFLAWHVVL